MLAIVLTVLLYGVLIEPRFIVDVEHEGVSLPGLPPQWEGQRIAVAGDFQVGMWMDNEGAMRKAVARILELRPAAVLLAGDFIYEPGPESTGRKVAGIIDILRPLTREGLPTFAVLGNHDYGMMTEDEAPEPEASEEMARGLESIGIRVLRNESVPVVVDGAPLYIVGVDGHWPGRDRPLKALLGVPRGAPRIVLMHHPDSFPGFPEGSAPLAVAGHTHGGQVRIPFLPHWSWRELAVEGEVHTDGWIDDAGFGASGNRLYINRGIGMSVVPIRINCTPEVTVFTLRREEQRPSSGNTRPSAAWRGQGERR